MNHLHRNSVRLTAFVFFAAVVAVACVGSKSNVTGANPTAPALNSARSYVVLGASAVTNTGGTAMKGDLGG